MSVFVDWSMTKKRILESEFPAGTAIFALDEKRTYEVRHFGFSLAAIRVHAAIARYLSPVVAALLAVALFRNWDHVFGPLVAFAGTRPEPTGQLVTALFSLFAFFFVWVGLYLALPGLLKWSGFLGRRKMYRIQDGQLHVGQMIGTKHYQLDASSTFSVEPHEWADREEAQERDTRTPDGHFKVYRSTFRLVLGTGDGGSIRQRIGEFAGDDKGENTGALRTALSRVTALSRTSDSRDSKLKDARPELD